MYAARTAGTKSFAIYWKLIEYKADTTEAVIATSPSSDPITTKRKVDIFCALTTDYIPTAGSRIVGKIYADIGTTGVAPDTALYIEGDEDSHWEIPVNKEILDSSYQPLDADLTAIAALGFTATAFLKKTAANTWALDTSPITDVTNFELEMARKITGNSYMEYTEDSGNVTQVNYWTNSGKGTKLFTKDITYDSGNPTLVVIEDEQTGSILTTTIAYSGEDITSVTKAVT
jgi:hypothetical protein